MTRGAFDVLVVGGGPAGSTVASHLAGAGASVVLCDAARFPRHKICGEYLPPAVVPLLAALGVARQVEALGPLRHVGMAVVSFDGTAVLGRYGGGAERGLALRRYDLDRVLLDGARRRGARVLEGVRVTGFTRSAGLFEVETRGGRPGAAGMIRARAVVGADGRNSLVARRLGLRRGEPGHRRWAVMAHMRGVAAPPDHGEMIVTSYGYCGINPLPGGLANVCIVLDPARQPAPLPGRARLGAFLRARVLDDARTRARLARAEIAAGPWATGPMACRTRRAAADGALLVGDAAGFFDPFTGEGIAMALDGGALAARALLAGFERGDLRAAALAGYDVERRRAFAPRLRFDRLLQRLIRRPRLTDGVARRLRRDPALADLLARVAGGTEDAGRVLRLDFLLRLMAA